MRMDVPRDLKSTCQCADVESRVAQAALRVEETLLDKKNDNERIAELQKTMRKEATAWFLADQAGKLIETFRGREARERALGMLLPQIIHINHYRMLAGCFDGIEVPSESA